MPRRRYKPEEIVAKLRQVDVLASQGTSMADAMRQIGASEVGRSGGIFVTPARLQHHRPKVAPVQIRENYYIKHRS